MAEQTRSQARAIPALTEILRSRSAYLFGAYMLANAMAYGYQMLMSRRLAPADYGALVSLTSIYYVIVVVVKAAQAWMIGAVAGSGGASPKPPRAVFLTSLRLLVPLGGLIFVLLWLGSSWVSSFLKIGDSTPVKVLGLYIFTEFLQAIVSGIMMGLNRFHLAGSLFMLEPIVRVVGGLSLVTLGLGVSGAMAGFPVGNVAVCVVALIVLRPLLAKQPDSGSSRADSLGLDRYALLTLVINVCLMAVISVDQVVVKHFFPSDVAGDYAVAWIIGRVIALSAVSLGWVIFASSATMAPDDPGRAWILFRGLLLVGSVTGALTAALFLAPRLFVSVMAGAQYDAASHYVGLIGLAMTLFSLVYIQAFYHLSLRETQVAWPLGIAVVLQITLMALYHESIQQVLTVLIFVLAGLLVAVSGLTLRLLKAGRSRPMATAEPTRSMTGAS